MPTLAEIVREIKNQKLPELTLSKEFTPKDDEKDQTEIGFVSIFEDGKALCRIEN